MVLEQLIAHVQRLTVIALAGMLIVVMLLSTIHLGVLIVQKNHASSTPPIPARRGPPPRRLSIPKTRFSLIRLLLARYINKLLGDDPGPDFRFYNPP